jgi:hypothetical protein
LKTSAKKAARKIKDLPESTCLDGLHFRDPKTGTEGYWASQWGYILGGAGVFYREDPKSSQLFTLCLDRLQDALEFEVIP